MQQHPSLWELVPATEYRLPQTPATRAARNRWVSLKRLFGKRRDEGQQPARAESDLRGLPDARLDALVAPVGWQPVAEGLARTLAEGGTGDGVSFFIGPPRAGHVDLLRRWATDNGARWIEPPTFRDILDGGTDWLAGWPRDARVWLLPRLEHCLLRHAAGLALVRELLDRALSGWLGTGVIGCDSWAWAYLRQVTALPARSALALQALDGERLAALFRSLVSVDDAGPVRFCNAQTGKLMLAVDGEDDGNGGTELQSLAAYCRGNAGLARQLWRRRLRAEPEPEASPDDDAGDKDAASSDEDNEIVWVAAPSQEPALAADGDEEPALVLHALLLHNGLPGPLLTELLPLPPFRVQAALHRLAAAGFVTAAESGHWRVTAAGYAPARDLLQAQGLLVDDF
jgi:hypothetical protein